MRLWILAFATALTACSQTEPELLRPEIPPQLLMPVPVPSRPVETVNDLAERLVQTRRGLERANGQIGAIAEIVNGPP